MRSLQLARRASFILSISLAAGTAATAIVGCADPARQRSEQAVGTLKDTREELADGRKEIDQVVATLATIESRPADLNKPYKEYVAQVKQIERTADEVRSRVQDMRLRSAAYSNAWMADANQNISNPDLRAASEERARTVKDRYDRIDQQAQDVRAAYAPFITELRDVETFLSNDLTYAGVDAAKPMLDTVRSSAENLKAKVDQLIGTLDEASTRLSPTTAPMP